MTFANIITTFRIILVPIFLIILLTEIPNGDVIAFIVFVLASVTDLLDGYVARKFNQVSKIGEFLDPLADKLLVSGALIALVSLGRVETWVAAIIILREILITAFRFYFFVSSGSFKASLVAKSKTLFQIIAIGLLIIYKKFPLHENLINKIGVITLYFALFLTIYSGIEYFFKYSKVQKKDNKKE